MNHSRRARHPSAKQRAHSFVLKGGLNLADAQIEIPDGQLLVGRNYELLTRDGLRRLNGIERCDGQASPSDARYWIQNFVASTATSVSEGDQVDGATSGASGIALQDEIATGTLTNQCPDPEDFSAWFGAGVTVTVTTNTHVAPDGTTTADTLNDASASVGLLFKTGISLTGTLDNAHTASIYIRKDSDETRFPILRLICSGGGTGCNAFCMLNTKTGVAHNSVSGGSGVVEVEDVDSNWWRLKHTITADDPHDTVQFAVLPAASSTWGNYSSVSSLTGSIIAWGAMLDEGDTPYYTATTTDYGYYVLTNVSGTFQDAEDLEVSSTKTAEAAGTAIQDGADTATLDATYAADAIETQRALIKSVGDTACSGPVRGVHMLNGTKYAFRDNAAGTAGTMWKATASGWSQIDLQNIVPFDTGTVEMVEGNTLTQGGATALIGRVIVRSGDWSTNDAAGVMIIETVTGGPFAAGAATDGVSGACNLTAAESAQTIQPGGRYEFKNDNFFGTSGTYAMYGVSGVDTAFEFDGTYYVPIATGNTNDTPAHLETFEYHLMLTFEKGSLQNSATGDPYKWASGGATEVGCGSDLIGIKKNVGNSLSIICEERVWQLQGKNTTDSPWNLLSISDTTGGIEWSLERIGRMRFLSNRGLTELEAVQAYGDFKDGVFSQMIEELITAYKNRVVASIRVRAKNQYRLFFDDGSGVIATFDSNRIAGFTTFIYENESGGTFVANCTSNEDDSSGDEVLLMGATDGYVYQIDKGTSFDGNKVAASILLAYTNLRSPSYDKQFKKVELEVEGAEGVTLAYNILLDYSSGRAPAGSTFEEQLAASGSNWNQVNWDQFNWAQQDLGRIEGHIAGVGRNIALQIASEGTYVEPHTLYAVTYHYIMRKLVR